MASWIIPVVVKVVVPLLESEGAEALVHHIFTHHPKAKEKIMGSNPQPVTAASHVYAAAQSLQAAKDAIPQPPAAQVEVAIPAVASISQAIVPPDALAPVPVAAPKQTVGQVIDTVLHDFILTGVLAASIFVKSPAHQQTAATIIGTVQQLLPVLDAQLNGTK